MRMGMRRFTRLTNAFSKKFDNHRIHQTLRVTLAMEAGLTDCVWSVNDLFTA